MKSRILYTKIWKDEFVSGLTPSDKLLFVYFITNERVNLIHCYEITEREISFDTGIDRDKIALFKEKLQTANKMHFYQNYVFLRNASKYETYSGIKNEKAIGQLLKIMPSDVLAWYNNIKNTPIDTPMHTPSIGTINHKSEIINIEGGVGETKNSKEQGVNDPAQRLVDFFNRNSGRNYRLTSELKKKIRTRLQNYTPEELARAVVEMFKLPFYKGQNDKKWEADPMFLFRSDENIEKFLSKARPSSVKRIADIIN